MTKREPEPSEYLATLAAGGTISKNDARKIAEELAGAVQSEDPDEWDFDRVYELVLVVGKGKIGEATASLERLLDAQEPMTMCLVLTILCEDWGRIADYLERVMTFAVGTVWDEELDVQERAIELLGQYVHNRISQEKGLASEAVRRVIELLWQQLASADENWIVRRAAYQAMLAALGRGKESISGTKDEFARLPALISETCLPAPLDGRAIQELRALAER